MVREKDTYKYLEILKVDTIKHADMKENKLKGVTLENEKISRNQTI